MPWPPPDSTPRSSPAATPRAPARWAARWSPPSSPPPRSAGSDRGGIRRRGPAAGTAGRLDAGDAGRAGHRPRRRSWPQAGFEWNPRLQEAFLPNPVTPISAPSNTGDGLELGLAAGGAVTAMRAVWGVPVLQDPAHRYDGRPSGRMAERRTHPAAGPIMVNAAGRALSTRRSTTTTSTRCSGSSTRTPGRTPTSRPGRVDSGYLRGTRSAAPRSARFRLGESAAPLSTN